MSGRVREYLIDEQYPKHVVSGGLPHLVANWEATAAGIRDGSPAYVMYEEFLNDMDGRRILQECLDLLRADEAAAVRRRVAQADQLFRDATLPTAHCIWGDATADERGYSRDKDWYYFRRPEEVDGSWPPELLAEAA